jgi:hypothetical protein
MTGRRYDLRASTGSAFSGDVAAGQAQSHLPICPPIAPNHRIVVNSKTMKTLSVGELDLLSFFEVEPSALEANVSWYENDWVYEIKDEHVHLSFAIAPLYGDVRVILKVGGVVPYELNAMGLEDVRHFNDKGQESLRLIVSARESIWLRIKPTISIEHRITDKER